MPKFSSYFLIIVYTIGHCTIAWTDDCHPRYDDFAIQFVLAQDNTKSYRKFVHDLQTLVPKLVGLIENQHPGSQFGLVTFGDWKSRTLDSNDSCYKRLSPLAAYSNMFLEKVKSIRIGTGGDEPETNLMGISLSVTDQNMGWSKEKVTPEGKRIVRVVAMATDATALPPGVVDFPPLKGLPSDSCDNQPPEPEFVGKVLRDYDVFFLGLISGKPEVFKKWEGYLRRMNVNGRGILSALKADLATEVSTELLGAVMSGIQEIICYTTTTTTTTTQTAKTDATTKTTTMMPDVLDPITKPSETTPEVATTPETNTTPDTTTTQSKAAGAAVGLITSASVGGGALLGAAVGFYMYRKSTTALADDDFDECLQQLDDPAERELQADTDSFT